MKKVFLLVAALCLCVVAFQNKTMAQSFKKGDLVLNAGIGFGSAINGTGSYGWKTSIPPISASVDYALINNLFDVDKLSLGVGAYVGYTSSGYEWASLGKNWDWSFSCFIPGVRGTVHYQISDKFEAYGGLMLGFAIYSYDYGDYWDEYVGYGFVEPDNTVTDFKFDGFVGARYYFTNNIGVYAELGFGIAYFNVGVSFKF